MKLKVVVHEAEEGGYWAEVPSIPGCATQGESFDELLSNIYEAVEGCLSVNVHNITISARTLMTFLLPITPKIFQGGPVGLDRREERHQGCIFLGPIHNFPINDR